MSDFDKEAERERLRKKYEREQEKRESTERMSELLLKGATMTDTHCGNCGDPIFRYDDEEFCPTCQERVVSGDEAAEATDATEGEADATAGAERDGTTESAATAAGPEEPASQSRPSGTDVGPGQSVDPSQRDANGTKKATAPETTPSRGDAATPSNAAASRAEANARNRQSQTRQSPSPAQSRPRPESQPQSPPESAGDADELGTARASLTRTLLAQARKAETCEDPRRAKDHLAAAREAAEALAALSY